MTAVAPLNVGSPAWRLAHRPWRAHTDIGDPLQQKCIDFKEALVVPATEPPGAAKRQNSDFTDSQQLLYYFGFVQWIIVNPSLVQNRTYYFKSAHEIDILYIWAHFSGSDLSKIDGA